MAKGILADLILRLSANAAELSQGIKQAERSLTNFESNAKTVGRNISNVFQFAGIGLGIKESIDFIKTSLLEFERSADMVNEISAGIKGAFNELQRSVIELDFSDFFRRFSEGYRSAVESVRLQDELEDLSAYYNNVIAGLEILAEKQRTIKNDMELSLDERKRAAIELKRIEEQIYNERISLIKKTYDTEKDVFRATNKIDFDLAKQLFDNRIQLSKKYSEEQIKLVEDVFNKISDIELIEPKFVDNLIKFLTIGGYELGKKIGFNIINDEAKNFVKVLQGELYPELQKVFTEPEIGSLLKYFKMLKEGAAGIVPNLYKIEQQYQIASANSLSRFNSVVKETSRIIAKTEKSVAKTMNLSDIFPGFQIDIGQLKNVQFTYEDFFKRMTLGTKNLALSFGQTLSLALPNALKSLAPQLEAVVKIIQDKVKQDLEGLARIISDGFADVIATWAEGIGRLAGGEPNFNFGESILMAIASFMSQLGRYMLSMAPIVKTLKTALKSFNPYLMAAAGIGLLAISGAIRAGIAKRAAASNFAQGGVVYGETFARIGEYSGVRTNPEIVAPLDRLRDIMGTNVLTNNEVIFRIGERELIGILSAANKKQVNF